MPQIIIDVIQPAHFIYVFLLNDHYGSYDLRKHMPQTITFSYIMVLLINYTPVL